MKNIRNIIEQKYPPENSNDLWMKDNVLYKSTHKGWIPLTADGGSSTNGVTSTTWLELKDKRDAGKLTPGTLYRITDYNCTTTQENTRSAGHQFDIVLLALSEGKLAEEGWAMMNESNIYDVTFADGVIKKCYIYNVNPIDYDPMYNLVDCDNLLGIADCPSDELEINEEHKTAIAVYDSEQLDEENVPYNYFQNSNLSAWKVWYCLDNDKSKFAWADDSVDEELGTITCSGTYSGVYGSNIICTRKSDNDFEQDGIHYYCYYGVRPGPSVEIYTTTENITYNTIIYEAAYDGQGRYIIKTIEDAVINSFTPTIITINGRGVIYHMIDEWNNDVPYDFKNIQYIRPLTDGEYDADSGTDTWVYTFNGYNLVTAVLVDGSLHHGELLFKDDYIKSEVNDNIIVCTYSINSISKYDLPNFCMLGLIDLDNDRALKIHSNIIRDCQNSTFQGSLYSGTFIQVGNSKINTTGVCYLMSCGGVENLTTYDSGIYIHNKKVLTEE